MSDPEMAVLTALREATAALEAGRRAASRQGDVPERGQPPLAHEIGRVLDELVGLLRAADLDPRAAGPTEHALHAVAQHVLQGADLARRAGRADREESRAAS